MSGILFFIFASCHPLITSLRVFNATYAYLLMMQSCTPPLHSNIRLQSSTHTGPICPCGQSGGFIDFLARHCLMPLGLPSAASGACAVVQKSPSKRQCGERQASLKSSIRVQRRAARFVVASPVLSKRFKRWSGKVW